jgi:hypothetical protein
LVGFLNIQLPQISSLGINWGFFFTIDAYPGMNGWSLAHSNSNVARKALNRLQISILQSLSETHFSEGLKTSDKSST